MKKTPYLFFCARLYFFLFYYKSRRSAQKVKGLKMPLVTRSIKISLAMVGKFNVYQLFICINFHIKIMLLWRSWSKGSIWKTSIVSYLYEGLGRFLSFCWIGDKWTVFKFFFLVLFRVSNCFLLYTMQGNWYSDTCNLLRLMPAKTH